MPSTPQKCTRYQLTRYCQLLHIAHTRHGTGSARQVGEGLAGRRVDPHLHHELTVGRGAFVDSIGEGNEQVVQRLALRRIPEARHQREGDLLLGLGLGMRRARAVRRAACAMVTAPARRRSDAPRDLPERRAAKISASRARVRESLGGPGTRQGPLAGGFARCPGARLTRGIGTNCLWVRSGSAATVAVVSNQSRRRTALVAQYHH